MTSEYKGVLGLLDIWYHLFFIIYIYTYRWVYMFIYIIYINESR